MRFPAFDRSELLAWGYLLVGFGLLLASLGFLCR